jgi:hypothetical protein
MSVTVTHMSDFLHKQLDCVDNTWSILWVWQSIGDCQTHKIDQVLSTQSSSLIKKITHIGDCQTHKIDQVLSTQSKCLWRKSLIWVTVKLIKYLVYFMSVTVTHTSDFLHKQLDCVDNTWSILWVWQSPIWVIFFIE